MAIGIRFHNPVGLNFVAQGAEKPFVGRLHVVRQGFAGLVMAV